MKRLLAVVVLAMWGTPALADMLGIGRVGFMAGIYNVDLEVVQRDALGDVVDRAEIDQTRTALGLLGGYTVAFQRVFGDLALEYQSQSTKDGSSFDRSDLLLSIGTFLPADFSLSAGYRFGWQGEGPFDREFYREVGPFVGIGFPSFGVFDDWRLSPSAAVNFTKLKFDDSDIEPRFIGVSLRGALARPGSPHAFGVRIQRFSGDEDEPIPGGSLEVDLTETYVHLFYQFSFLPMGQ